MTTNVEPPESAPARPSAVWPIRLLIACGWILLFAETLRVREANLDDVNFQRITTDGGMREYIAAWGPVQGRYYGMAAFGPIWMLDSIANAWLFQMTRLGLVAASLWLLGRLAFKVTGSVELNRLWWLLWIGCLQIPPTFYGLLSYPEMQCGLIFVLLAAHVFWHHLESHDPSRRQRWMAGLLFFAGLQFHESFLAFFLLFAALSWWHGRSQARFAWIAPLAPIAVATAVYLGIYFAYRAAYSASSYYEGTRAGFSLGGAFLYIFRYGASSLPGFELLIDRNPAHAALATPAEIGRRLGTFQLWRLPWAVAVGAASAWMLSRAERWTLSRRDTLLFALGCAAVGLLFMSMPAVSDKYQSFAHRRFYPHTYNFIMISFLWLSAAVGSLGLASSAPARSRARCGIAGSLGLLFGLACLVAQITNPLAIAEIKALVSGAN